nr:DUF1801 domain-containing protein [Bacteroidota bacterium]
MSKKQNNLALGISESEKVDEYLDSFVHPLIDVVKYLRHVILKIDKNIGEGIYWNTPTFYYTGGMPPFDAKEYRRYIIGFVFNKQDCVRMVFLRGANAIDKNGILEGQYEDGRRLITFQNMDDVKSKEKAFINIIQQLVKQKNS